MCHKEPFLTKEECEASIKLQKLKFKLYCYLCPECGAWHKTKAKQYTNVNYGFTFMVRGGR